MVRASVVLVCVGFMLAACATASEGAARPTPPAPPEVVSPTPGWQGVATPSADTSSMEEEAVLTSSPAIGKPGTTARRALRTFTKTLAAVGGGPTVTKGTPPEAAAVDEQQKLVITGALEVSTHDVRQLVDAVRANTHVRGGIVVSDELTGARYGVRARLQVRLPPAEVGPFVEWLATQGQLESKHLTASDVSRQYFDEEVRLRTLRTELDRLQKLMSERENVPLADVLAIERETTRVRDELEHLEGQHLYLADRVARATLDVHITAPDDVVVGAPSEKFLLVAHGLALSFADDGDRHRQRFGGGVSMLLGRRFDLTFDVLPSRGADARSMLLTMGAAAYSDFLGRGRRLIGNPYLGLRAGGGGVNGRGTFAFGGELGVELVHHPRFLLDLTGRAMALYSGRSTKTDIAFQGLLGVGVPF